jgi:hypothetical protein
MNKLLPLAVAASLFLALQARAETPPSPIKFPSEYSVEIVTTAQGQAIPSKMYQAKDKTRTETSVQGMQSVSIMRQDLKKMYTLMPAQKMYMEIGLDNPMMKSMAPQDMTKPQGDMKWEKLGSETVNGAAADKYKVTTTHEGKTSEMFYYVDAKGFPVRVEMNSMGQVMTVDYKNWSEGAPDASLFEVPAGYSKMPGM